MSPRKKAKVEPKSVGLGAAEVAKGKPPKAVAALAEAIVGDGGAALATYREPLGSHWVVLAALPIDAVEPTPYQRELSDAHAKRLASVIPKVGRFLDPVIAMRAAEGVYWTPNGMHRLEAMKRLGARTMIALVVPEADIALRILALNTEKAHNLKDKSLEVVRMAHALAEGAASARRPESDWAFEFEEPGFLTVGHCYEKNKRFSGGAYMPVVRRCEAFLDQPIAEALEVRLARADKLLALDKKVDGCVKALKAAGLTSAYLKPFVVARINPIRFAKRGTSFDFDETVDKMIAKAEKFDASKVKASDLTAGAAAYGAD